MIYKAALQAAIFAGACSEVHALGYLDEVRGIAGAAGVNVTEWPAAVVWR